MSVPESPAGAIELNSKGSAVSWRERANSELEKIVELFSSKELPGVCAKALIQSLEKPSSKWSLGNQLLMLLAGTTDARGFRQWHEVGRYVTKNARAFFILGPVVVKKQTDGRVSTEERAEEEERILVGFRGIPVFRFEDTLGRELPVYRPRDPPPLLEVAQKFGMKVQYERLSPRLYGVANYTTSSIVLASEDWDVFFNEHAQAIHRTFEPKTEHEQEEEAETTAQLVAATLARLYGRPADNFSWSYISSYARSNSPQKVGRLCMRVQDMTKKVLERIYPVQAS
jgi:hypothetical protein